MVRTATAVRSELSATGAALAAGRIGYAQAAAVTRSVQALPAEVTVPPVGPDGEPDLDAAPVPLRAVGERHLLALADGHDAGQLGRIGRHLLAVVAPEIGEAVEAEALARQEEHDRQHRHLTWSVDDHGVMRFSGHLDPEAAQIVKAPVEALSARHPMDGQRDERTPGHRRADAMVELCRRNLESGDLPARGGEPPQVVVHIPLRTLYDGLGPAAYQDGTRISPGLAHKLACCAKIIPSVLGGGSAVLDLGRTARLFAATRRRAVTLRDKGCAFPGCDRPPAWCDIHHIIAWWLGGRTDISNAVVLCEHHHHVVHEEQWTIVIAPDASPNSSHPPGSIPNRDPDAIRATEWPTRHMS